MELMQNHQTTGHHGMQVDMLGSDDVIGGSWHSSKSPVSRPIAHTLENGVRTQTNKGKAKDLSSPGQRIPRRVASSRALEHVMRNSAPPAAVRASSPPAANISSDATVDGSNLQIASSSSPPRMSTLTNGHDSTRRRVHSLSPFPKTRSNGMQHPSSAPPTSADESGETTSVIDSAEQDQFHFQAAPDSATSILARPAPTLPYDTSYLPLSPNNIDQLGHILVPVSTSGQSTVKGIGEMAKHGRGHAASNKKVLPGQDLEEHVISQVPGHRAIPWGLQTTLRDSQQGGERARNKMGILKRTALLRDINRRGKLTPTTLKMEEDVLSEAESPRLPLIEISEVVAATTMPQAQLSEADEGKEVQDFNGGDIIDEESKSTSPPPASEVIETPQMIQPLQNTDNIPKKRGRGRKSQVLALTSWPTSADESMLSGESSSQEGATNTKRPREAHKRLKLVGGYYCKLSRHREDKPEQIEGKSDAAAPLVNGASGSMSRGTSFAPEDVTSLKQDEGHTNGSQSDLNGGMSSSPPPIIGSIKQRVATSTPLTGMRRVTSLQGSPSKLMHASGEAVNANNSEAANNEFCETCRGVGHFICCDGCPRSFHFACINPPLDIDELPNSIGDAADTWYCNVCRGAGKGKKREKGKQSGNVFAPLLRLVEEENPTIFTLPLDIRNYFKGVTTASDGSYINTSMLRPIKVNKFGIVEEREPLRLKDKNGRPILCFQCGESAMPSELALSSPSRQRERPARQAAKAANAAVFSQSTGAISEEKGSKTWRNMVSCDFCSLHWHLDCLEPPLATMPSLSRKWMCPNHIEHVLPSERIPKSVANSTSVHDLPMPSKETIGPGKHYRMRVVNDGQIDIIPDPMDTYTGPAHDVDGIGIAGDRKSSSTGSGEKGWKEMLLPAYKGYPTVFGSQNNVKFKYRIPEKVIRLDFWSKIELQREKLAEAVLREERKSRKDGLDLLAIVANAASFEQQDDDHHHQQQQQPPEPKKMTKSVAKILVEKIFSQKPDHPYVEPGQEPVSLLRQSYIQGDDEDEDLMEGVTSGKSEASSSLSSAPSIDALYNGTQAIDQTDKVKLQSIQELIAYKGKDALLRFLLE